MFTKYAIISSANEDSFSSSFSIRNETYFLSLCCKGPSTPIPQAPFQRVHSNTLQESLKSTPDAMNRGGNEHHPSRREVTYYTNNSGTPFYAGDSTSIVKNTTWHSIASKSHTSTRYENSKFLL